LCVLQYEDQQINIGNIIVDSALEARQKVSLAENTSNVESDVCDDDASVSVPAENTTTSMAVRAGKKRRHRM
jgi:hypothetical protein